MQKISSPLFKHLAADSRLNHADARQYSPFLALVRHFAGTIVRSGSESGAISNSTIGIGGLLALLAVPGGFAAIFLFEKYASLVRLVHGRLVPIDVYVVSLPDKYFFIVYSMVITSVVVAFKWERILPGRQDYFNIAALPLRLQTVFAANFTAVFLLALLFTVDVNATSAVLFPLAVMSQQPIIGAALRFVGVHAICVTLASGFAFLLSFGTLGILMSVLPQRAFRAISGFVRSAIIVASVALLCTEGAVARAIRHVSALHDSFIRFLPPVWYVALYQRMQGRSNAEFVSLASWGLKAIVILLLAVAISAILAYRRYFVRIPEVPRSPGAIRHWRLDWFTRLMNRVSLRSGFQRGCYRFGMRVLLRSESHFIALAAFIGFGLILAAQMMLSLSNGAETADGRLPPAQALGAVLAVAYCLILGVRFVLEIPATLQASWIYPAILDRQAQDTRGLAKRITLTLLIPLVMVPCAAVFAWLWGIEMALLSATYVTAVSGLFMDLLLVRFRKIPFACAPTGFENNTIMMVFLYGVGFALFTRLGAALGRAMLARPILFFALPLFWAGWWLMLRKLERETPDFDKELVYESGAGRAVQTLDL